MLLTAAAVQGTSGPEWTTSGMKGDVALAFRDDSALAAREVRATTELRFPADRIFAIVCDLSGYKTVVPGIQEARTIAGAIPADYEIYLRYAPRFLVVAARDVVLRVQGGPRGDRVFGCQWSEIAGRVAESRGVVRMPLLRGSWTIEALDANRARVVYQVTARPGGNIPAWLVRRGALSALPDVIDQVRQRLAGHR
jgi:ribosome-associated toxin RatA of RatAB toxin-antitoxin module